MQKPHVEKLSTPFTFSCLLIPVETESTANQLHLINW